MMVLKAKIVRVQGSSVTFVVKKPDGDDLEREITAPDGSQYAFDEGDEVFWWPGWDIEPDPESEWPEMRAIIRDRLVRRSDVSEEELRGILQEIERQEAAARLEAEKRAEHRKNYGGDG